MAKSIGYYGLRRGSTKSHTYSVDNGIQITKDRVEGGKNPRTYDQMTQRCILATCGNAYSAMKSICDHSFEELTAGKQCMREFMSTNMKKIQLSKEYDSGFFGFCGYKTSAFQAGSYVISDGSLPDALVDAYIDSVDVANKKVVLNLVSTLNGTIAEVADAMGCKFFDDMCTVALMYPKADGSYGFGAVRFTYKSGATVLDSFAVAVTGDAVAATPSFTTNTLKVEVRMSSAFATGASVENTYMAAITSRKVNGIWRRSKAHFDVTDAVPTFAQAISTYPVGQERFLNGGDISEATTSSTGGTSSTTDGNGSNANPTNGGGGTDSGGGTNTGGSDNGGNTGGDSGGDNGGGDNGGGGSNGDTD